MIHIRLLLRQPAQGRGASASASASANATRYHNHSNNTVCIDYTGPRGPKVGSDAYYRRDPDSNQVQLDRPRKLGPSMVDRRACAGDLAAACCPFSSRKDSVVLTVAKALAWYPYT
jgi:hypothetical protein